MASTGMVLPLPDDLELAEDGTIVLVEMVSLDGKTGYMAAIVDTVHGAIQKVDPSTGEIIDLLPGDTGTVRIMDPRNITIFDENGVIQEVTFDN